MKFSPLLKALIVLVFFLSSCNVDLILPTTTPVFIAPPMEGESSAPPLETSVKEIFIEKNTPSGVCVINEASELLHCFNIYGILISGLSVPGIGSSDPQGLHIAGHFGEGTALPPVVYNSCDPEQTIMQSENGITAPLRKTNSFLAISGAAGKPILAFSDMYLEDNVPHSFLFSGTLLTLGKTNAFFEMTDSVTGMALIPVGVEAVGEQARKVWYTQTAWEISGADRVYPINRGLFVFDLETGENSQVLDSERNFQGLSPDKAFAGSISFNLKNDQNMRVTNLLTGDMVNFSLNSSSDRGAGYAVFSIDGKYAAWLEASGSMITEPPEFQSLIRIGDIETGTVIHEVDSSTTSHVLAWDRVSFMQPVGWLNSQILVIEVRGSDRNTSALIKYDISTGRQELLCEGIFAGFSYP